MSKLTKRLEEIEQVMLKHTPGDWQIETKGGKLFVISGGMPIALMIGDKGQIVSDGYLMAAGKDMFNALKEVVHYALDEENNQDFDKESTEILNKCVDAIKKAEGVGLIR